MSALRRAAFKLLSVHDVIYQRSGGWIGHRIPFAPPNLLLHSIGAKTGQARTNTLTYAQDGGNYLIVASNAGAKRAQAALTTDAARDEPLRSGARRLR